MATTSRRASPIRQISANRRASLLRAPLQSHALCGASSDFALVFESAHSRRGSSWAEASTSARFLCPACDISVVLSLAHPRAQCDLRPHFSVFAQCHSASESLQFVLLCCFQARSELLDH